MNSSEYMKKPSFRNLWSGFSVTKNGIVCKNLERITEKKPFFL